MGWCSNITQYAKQGGVWRGFSSFGPFFCKKQRPPSPQEVLRCPKYIPRYLWPSSTSSENIGTICNHLHRLLQWFSWKMPCKNTFFGAAKTPFLAIPDPKKSNLPHICPDKIFLRCVVTILLFLKVAWDVRDMLDAKKCDWDSIKKS